MDEHRRTLYASRRLDRPMPAVAADVETSLTRRDWHPVDGTGPTRSRDARRAFRGLLRTGSGRRLARVELEVLVWSERATELGLRPLGRRAGRVATRRAYGEAAAELLDRLACRRVREAPLPRRAVPRLRRAS